MAFRDNAPIIPTSGSLRPSWPELQAKVRGSREWHGTYTVAPPDMVRKLSNDLSPYEISKGGALLGIGPIELVQVGQVATSAIRQVATIVSAEQWGRNVPTIDDTANEGVIIDSTTTAPDPVDPGFGLREFVPTIFASGPLNISRAILRDSPPALSNMIYICGQRLGRIQNRTWTVGAQPGMPGGIVAQATLGVTSASASAIAIDEVIQLTGSINAAYLPNAKLMMNTDTWTTLRQLKSTSSDDYLWRLAGLDKFDIVFNDHMPDIAAGSRPILFGDFATFIVSESGVLNVQQMNELRAEYYENVLEIFQPADAILADAAGNAVAALQMAAS